MFGLKETITNHFCVSVIYEHSPTIMSVMKYKFYAKDLPQFFFSSILESSLGNTFGVAGRFESFNTDQYFRRI